VIHIDNREGGSKQDTTVPRMLSLLQSHRFHPPCSVSTLPAGDFFFTGHGPITDDNTTGTVSIGLERKTISDFFNSSNSGRLVAEQLPKLIDLYNYRYLIIEGQAKVDWSSGELMELWNGSWVPIARKIKNRTVSYTGEQLLGAMNTIATFTPVTLIRTFGLHDTLDVVATLWHWWSKPYDKHSTLKKFHSPSQTTVLLEKASFVRRVAKELPGVSWEKSGHIESRFKSVDSMCRAEVEDWADIPGIGEVLSNRIYKQLKGVKD
jgi:ERCC4-type nuclease